MTTPTEQRVMAIVARKLGVAPEQVPLDQPVMDGLGLDSFDAMDVILDIEDAYEHVTLSEADARDLTTLREVADYIDGTDPQG